MGPNRQRPGRKNASKAGISELARCVSGVGETAHGSSPDRERLGQLTRGGGGGSQAPEASTGPSVSSWG